MKIEIANLSNNLTQQEAVELEPSPTLVLLTKPRFSSSSGIGNTEAIIPQYNQ